MKDKKPSLQQLNEANNVAFPVSGKSSWWQLIAAVPCSSASYWTLLICYWTADPFYCVSFCDRTANALFKMSELHRKRHSVTVSDFQVTFFCRTVLIVEPQVLFVSLCFYWKGASLQIEHFFTSYFSSSISILTLHLKLNCTKLRDYL